MYRAFLYFAFLAFCSAAPYADLSAVQPLPNRPDQQVVQPPVNIIKPPQRDETDLVDTLGAGYEFFKRQPIVSRPLAQQKLAISEQQVPISSLDDTSNHWSDYTKASVFKQKTVQTPTMPVKNDLLVSDSYGQQQQQDLPTIIPQQQVIRDFGNSYDQQQRRVLPTMIPQQSSVMGDFSSSYDQQQQDLDIVMPQQQSVIRDFSNSYDQQRKVVPTVIPQQAIMRDFSNSYNQQRTLPTIVPQQSVMRDFGSSFSQQQQDLPTIIPQQQSVIRDFGNSYNQQQRDLPTIIPQQQVMRDFGSSYNQQRVLPTVIPQQQQQQVLLDQSTLTARPNSAFGQQVSQNFNDLTRTGDFVQRQPDVSSAQFMQPTSNVQQIQVPRSNLPMMSSSRFASQSQPAVQTSNSGPYGGW